MNLLRRDLLGAVACGASAFVAGCSDPVSWAELDLTGVRSEREEFGWRTQATVEFYLSGLSESEGVRDVSLLLLSRDGDTLREEPLGDFVWNELPEEHRHVRREDVTFYVAELDSNVAVETGGFPFWLSFTLGNFDLTRAVPTVTTLEHVGAEEGEPPASTAEEDDWVEVAAGEVPGRGG